MKLNDVKRFPAHVRTIYHSEYITSDPKGLKTIHHYNGRNGIYFSISQAQIEAYDNDLSTTVVLGKLL